MSDIAQRDVEYQLYSQCQTFHNRGYVTKTDFDLLNWLHSVDRADWILTAEASRSLSNEFTFVFRDEDQRPKTLAEMTDDERKALPVFSGVIDYFPDALLEVAAVSKAGNDQHNPGEPLHWAKHKSQDHLNTAMRHEMQHGTKDKDGRRHLGKAAWRVLAALQIEIEAERASMTVEEYNEHLRDIAAEKKK
jgi:hypothetical protein